MKILFVCIGNICRSPIAEGVLKQLAQEQKYNWEIDSAATHSYHIGSKPHVNSIKVAKNHGIDISYQQARQLTESDIDYYDIIYTMAEDVHDTVINRYGKQSHIELITSIIPHFPLTSVPDPYYGEYDGYEETYAIILELCKTIIQRVGTPSE